MARNEFLQGTVPENVYAMTVCPEKNDPPFSGLVEFTPGFRPRPEIRYVLFDFDGTLSLIRQGWPEVMVPMFVEMLPRQGDETDADLRRLAYDDIMRLNGKQTIFQMIQLAERITQRGGSPREPLWYKHEYLRRLDQRIGDRVEGLRSGRIRPDELLVHGSRQLLEQLSARGFTLYLASGTDEPLVKAEAELLDVARYFGPRIFGRRTIIRTSPSRWSSIASSATTPSRASGCWPSATVTWRSRTPRRVGGLAVAVASDEANNGSGAWIPGSGSGSWASVRTS